MTRVLVVGAGLIGGSIALAAKNAGHETHLLEMTPELTSSVSALLGVPSWQPGIEIELVVVATPPHSVMTVISEQIRLNPSATFIDVASIKTEVLVDVESNLGKLSNFVPTHPMAGKESSGAKSATYDLFQNRVWVVTPPEYASPYSVQQTKDFIGSLGSVVIEMKPDEHDQVVALTSHAPQVLATALAAATSTVAEPDLVVSAQGLQDMTRLAGSDSALWSEILVSNRENVVAAIDKIRAQLSSLEKALNDLNLKDVKQFIDNGNEQRRRIPGKHGGKLAEYTIVPIEIVDEPGALGAIFQFAGEQGVNIEDIRIDHALGKEIAIIELHVLPAVAEAFKTALRGKGWKLRFEA